MTTVQEIYDLLNEIAPFAIKDKRDNSGFQVGDPEKVVRRVCFALDATRAVAEECAKKKADLLITHHPLLFHPRKSIYADSIEAVLLKQDIALISAHTNYDIARLSGHMLNCLSLPETGESEVLEVVNPDGSGYGKIVDLPPDREPIEPEELACKAKEAFQCKKLRYVKGNRPISRLAVCSGKAGDNINLAIEKGCDAYICGDVAWENFIDAKNHGITLIDAGHFYTENIMCRFLCDEMNLIFPDIDMFVAENSVDVCEYL
jgi:dinuclear metal center YbgI/SA1388 family protein